MTDAQIKAKFDRLHAEHAARRADRKAKGLCLECGSAKPCECAFEAWVRNRQSTAHAHGTTGPSRKYLRAQWGKK